MRASTVCAGLFLSGSLIFIGCNSDTKPQGPAAPTTMAGAAPTIGGANAPVATQAAGAPTTEAATLPTTVTVNVPNATPEVVTPPPATAPATAPATPEVTAPPVTPPPATAPLAPAFMPTHVLTKDEPYYKALPAAPTAPNDGTLKAGTKVLVFSFNVPWCKVSTEDGLSVFVAIDGIDPIAK